MSKHTPGPWRVGNSDEVYAGTKIVAGTYSSGDYMPHPEAKIDGQQVGLVEPKESIANVRLIAAAPEMLEALKAAEQILKRSPNLVTNDRGRFRNVSTISVEAEVRAAIAKAEGREK